MTNRCKHCKVKFGLDEPYKVLHGDCVAPWLAAHYAKKAIKAKTKERTETRKRKEALLTRSDWIKRAQVAFNAYIRARDYGKLCICCDSPIFWGSGSTGGVCDAGHFLSVGSRINLRFNEDNVHAQRKYCNDYLSGNAVHYRMGLIKRIGLARVEALESDHTLQKWGIDDLKEIVKKYKKMTKELSR